MNETKMNEAIILAILEMTFFFCLSHISRRHFFIIYPNNDVHCVNEQGLIFMTELRSFFSLDFIVTANRQFSRVNA